MLISAFFKKTASANLAEAYEETMGLKPQAAALTRFWLLLFGVLALVTFNLDLNRTSRIEGKGIVSNLFVGTVIFFVLVATYVFKYKVADIRFLFSCWNLSEFSSRPGVYSREELKSMAERKLVDLALIILLKEYGGDYCGAANFRDSTFKRQHRAFLPFGLVEDAWDIYFIRAKAEMGSPAQASSPPSTD
jgi:hypothetical protein